MTSKLTLLFAGLTLVATHVPAVAQSEMAIFCSGTSTATGRRPETFTNIVYNLDFSKSTLLFPNAKKPFAAQVSSSEIRVSDLKPARAGFKGSSVQLVIDRSSGVLTEVSSVTLELLGEVVDTTLTKTGVCSVQGKNRF